MPERNAGYWLTKAEEARAKADQMHDPSARDAMLRIAAGYELMAERAKRMEVRARPEVEKPAAN